MSEKIIYWNSYHMRMWLETALKMEWKKFANTPAIEDLPCGSEEAQIWGYVVTGYTLMEQGLKAALHMREIKPNPLKTHALSFLFLQLPKEDQDVLCTYYSDFRRTFDGMSSFPFENLDDFLKNLDGSGDNSNNSIGMFDWRYILTQQVHGGIPHIRICIMHEITYGCIQLLHSITHGNDNVKRATYSYRLWDKRVESYQNWLKIRENSPQWEQEGDRIELLWGPDYDDRCDYLIFEGGKIQPLFEKFPSAEDHELAVIDKRDELKSLDTGKEVQSIGATVSRTLQIRLVRNHLMY